MAVSGEATRLGGEAKGDERRITKER
eukprot:COSAG01_NODE_51620_length_353_cov_0.976378_1_plen_25_part_01